ncbi:hypothetical protein LINPERPRIM_LOCUS1995 [Linum perenne]
MQFNSFWSLPLCKRRGDSMRNEVRRLIWRSAVCYIWKERCRRVFAGIEETAIVVLENVKNEIVCFAANRIDKSVILSFL